MKREMIHDDSYPYDPSYPFPRRKSRPEKLTNLTSVPSKRIP
jgi:hypothetical protein